MRCSMHAPLWPGCWMRCGLRTHHHPMNPLSLFLCPTFLAPACGAAVQYRALRNYRSPSFLLARLGDKIVFGAVLCSLYWGIGESAARLGPLSGSALSASYAAGQLGF